MILAVIRGVGCTLFCTFKKSYMKAYKGYEGRIAMAGVLK